MAATPKRYFARRPMGYAGSELDRGQVFTPVSAPNDEKLERLGFMEPIARDTTVVTCAECGADFMGESERRGHGDKRHRGPLSPLEEDQLADREERMLGQIAPLYLEKSAAAQA